MRVRTFTEQLTVFDGADQVVELVRALVHRPRFGEAPERTRDQDTWRRRGRKGIPMVCLVRDVHERELLAELDKRLEQARPKPVPHARYTYGSRVADWPESGDRALKPAHASDVEPIRAVLSDLAVDLAGRDGAPRFRRFRLVRWLTEQSLRDAITEPDGELLRRLRERDLARRRSFATERTDELTDIVPSWARFVLRLVPPLWFRAKISGLGAEYRWLLRQPYLAPRDPGTFAGFAERLTTDKRAKEDPEQLLRLLVNAFLADLRHAYRRRPWRPGAARRTSYVVILLDGVSRANGGYRLLKLINDVRNDTGAFDPVLFVSGSEKVPPFAVKSDEHGTPAVPTARNALQAYRKWSERFSTASRARTPTAWYLPIRVPQGPNAESDRFDEARERLLDTPAITSDPAPLWSRRWVLALVTLALVGAVVGVEEQQRQAHCGVFFLAAEASTLVTAGDECVGVSERGFAFQPSDRAFSDVQAKVGELNQRATDAHRANPKRPLVSLVFVAAQSSPNQSLASERESLAGIAVAQDRQIEASGDNNPLLRVLVANVGFQMRHGPEVAELLGRMVARDSSIIGAIGFDQSRQPALETIDALSRIGLPMVAATLSADHIPDRTSLYFQVSPRNQREAAIAARYTDEELKPAERKVLVLSPDDPGDTYSNNLRDDLRASFGTVGFVVETRDYALSPGAGEVARQVGADVCGYRGVVFFTGRSEDFDLLLDGVNARCRGVSPMILAGDDISRYVADRGLRARYAGVPFDYLTFATGGAGCDTGGDLYARMKVLVPNECGGERDVALDEYAPLAYDATLTYIKAVEQVRESPGQVPLDKASVWHELSSTQTLVGESGTIDFGGKVDQRWPLNKYVAVVRVNGPGQTHPTVMATCGLHQGDPPSAAWCPHD
ncbi:ABC transporter substrate-binding protein [Actinocrispum wychmicini]|uniref:ABC-type branched-subunit amino acid transport system substrate-binding protein n=1 Tax=Actinocrispum wychmicini TaxID=1213861 RepID=A0A4R2IZG7_9PSEU|nr:ABC transporter substrate-binding protein [Actinocrispum wychmicini]TCO50737.1 ABC-type branched-subunit amino acid transport system substrate-binding protein [Actinocrispum wychmicini]